VSSGDDAIRAATCAAGGAIPNGPGEALWRPIPGVPCPVAFSVALPQRISATVRLQRRIDVRSKRRFARSPQMPEIGLEGRNGGLRASRDRGTPSDPITVGSADAPARRERSGMRRALIRSTERG